MVINNVQYAKKQSIVALLALLTAPVELLAEGKFLFLTAVSPGMATALIAIPLQESPACS